MVVAKFFRGYRIKVLTDRSFLSVLNLQSMENNKSSALGWAALVIIIVIIGGYLFTRSSSAPEAMNTGPIKIGFVGPLTGDAANIGQNAKAAVDIAVDEVNKAGGLNGRPLQVIYEDGKCNGVASASAANKLINIDKVPVILGGACSGETLAFAATAEQTKTVVLSYCSSAPAITNAGDYIFRDYPSDSFQGSFAADYIYNILKKKNVAVMYVKSDWGVGIKDVFEAKFKELGGTVIDEEGYDQTAKDLRTELTKVKASKPELVYFLGYTDESIVGLKQAKEIGLKAPLFGGDAWDDAKIWTETGTAGDNAMYSVVSSNPSHAFKLAMKAKVGSDEIAVCSPTAYDAVKIIAQVMNKVGGNPAAIKDALYSTDYTRGVSSPEVKFDSNGDLVGANYVIKVIKNGKAEVLK